MGDNPALPPSVGRRLESVCQSCGNRGLTVKGIDNERQFAIVQCDTCGKIASVDVTFLFWPD
jgi:transcription elongation factor Elf1